MSYRLLWGLVSSAALVGCASDKHKRLDGLEEPPAGSPYVVDIGVVGAAAGGGSGGDDGGMRDAGAPLKCLPDDPAGADAGVACSASSYLAAPPPLGLYLMIDRSGSMAEATGAGPTKWSALGWALDDVLSAPPVPAMTVGAQFFPSPSGASECDASGYAEPLVALMPVASARGAVANAMGSLVPDGTTPMGPALIGAVNGASAWAKKNPKASSVVVLATDGQPSSCSPAGAAGLAAVAAAGLSTAGGRAPVATFVIGILSANDVASGALSTLDSIAKAGGTDQASLINPSMDVAQQLSTALRAVAARSVACSFSLPASFDDTQISSVNVTLESAACGSHQLSYVPPSKGCGADGWKYDVDPALGVTPTKVVLCATSCERFRAGDHVSIEIGCATKGWSKT